MHQPEKVELTNTQVTYRIDSSGEHDPLLFLSSESSPTAPSHVQHYTSLLLQRHFTGEHVTLPSCFVLFPAFLSHSLFFFTSFSLFILSEVGVFVLLQHIRNDHCWVKAVLSSNCQQERENRCVFSLMTVQFFIIIPLVLEVLLSPRG